MANVNKMLLKAAKKGDVALVQKALDDGADIETTTGFWVNTPLNAAAAGGHVEVMKLLIEKGARLDAVNAIGYTALHNAVEANSKEAVELLLEKGASTGLRDSGKRTALDTAQKYKKETIVEAFRNHERRKLAEHVARLAREEAIRAAMAKELAEKQRKEEQARVQRASKEYIDIVVFKQNIGDIVLEDAFNFASLERLTFVRKGPGGDVQSMTRQSFQDVDNKKLLRQAFEEHVRRGGKTPECDVFENCDKPKITKLPGGPL